ncbi:ABC transporter permease [Paenibacillus motobuensis]|uniref:ABC transporter permease n=1 Tax=Paenibacillus TaxID=44249 RepID=UPI00203EB1EF|nr:MULTISPECIES: ABC transporter permease [Paenibacillus]MCM3039883.1 ABC transporter permease [Paenibacillus lutimineralis]MCM3646987.1 ABC transporter permease [Paenibacillus motobuensis]
MFMIIFRSMIVTSLRDRISLFYSILFPAALLFGLGLYFDSPEYRFNLLTGTVLLSTLFWSVQGTAFQVHQQRNRGVYKLLKVTPLSNLSFVLNVTLARTVLGLIINGIILAIGMIAYAISFPMANLAVLGFILAIGTLCFTAMGFFVSNLAQNEAQINMFSNLIYIPMLFGSETFYSLQHAPQWIKTAGNLFPLTYLVEGVRISYTDIGEVLPYIGIVAAFTVALIFLAALTFRFDADQTLLFRKYRKV